MKKHGVKIVLGLIVGALAVTLIAGTAFAQGPQANTAAGQTNGYGARFGRMGGPAWGRVATFDAVTELTGLSEEEIIAERQAGKSLAEIAAAEGVSQDKLVEAILAEKKAALDALVADGTITADQAATMLSNMTEQVTESVTRTDVGPRWGGQGGRGQMGGGQGLGPCGLGLNAA